MLVAIFCKDVFTDFAQISMELALVFKDFQFHQIKTFAGAFTHSPITFSESCFALLSKLVTSGSYLSILHSYCLQQIKAGVFHTA